MMRKLKNTKTVLTTARVVAFCVAMIALPILGQAQEPIPDAKKQLIVQLMDVMHAGNTVQKTFEAMMGQMAVQFPKMLTDLSAARQDLTLEQRARVKSEATRSFAHFSARFRERMGAIYASQEFYEKVYYPTYAKYYNEAELQDMITFYKSPTGQKMLQVQPEMTADMMARTFEVLGPKVQQMMQELLQEELERIKNQK
jgi:uncharacterized protein